ncbi:hypothetical protein CXG49_14900 [Pseudomonas guariconensis]|uniref:Uncharacterized protein n=1 Tax=Pseudomonas guariconensis TaxID=1288410 RepID=A0AAX0VW66_9PSED|nr:hypothetical protein CXG49_14900 [Pseudomonas guariconensis]
MSALPFCVAPASRVNRFGVRFTRETCTTSRFCRGHGFEKRAHGIQITGFGQCTHMGRQHLELLRKTLHPFEQVRDRPRQRGLVTEQEWIQMVKTANLLLARATS